MKTIEVLGPGCDNCVRLEANVREAVSMAGIDAEIVGSFPPVGPILERRALCQWARAVQPRTPSTRLGVVPASSALGHTANVCSLDWNPDVCGIRALKSCSGAPIGVDYNAHSVESILKYVAPDLGWR